MRSPAGESQKNGVMIVWVVKGLLFLALLFALVYFFLDNSTETVDINLFGRHYLAVPLYWILVMAFLLGFATSFVIGAWRELRAHHRLRRLKGEIQAKEKEINELRTLPLQDLPHPQDGEGGEVG